MSNPALPYLRSTTSRQIHSQKSSAATTLTWNKRSLLNVAPHHLDGLVSGLGHDVALVLAAGRRGSGETGTQGVAAELLGGKAGVADMAFYDQGNAAVGQSGGEDLAILPNRTKDISRASQNTTIYASDSSSIQEATVAAKVHSQNAGRLVPEKPATLRLARPSLRNYMQRFQTSFDEVLNGSADDQSGLRDDGRSR
jgi:hypothetical protein